VKWRGPDGHEYFVGTHPDVYVPSHDTFLLAAAVAKEVQAGQRFLDVGCGAGLVGLVAARNKAVVTCTDLNPHAVGRTRENARENQLTLEVVQTDLLEGLAGPFDVVAFNPPYLPTAPDERLPGGLNMAFDGGPDGNATVLRFARQVVALRPKPPVVLVVHSSLSDPLPLAQALAAAGYREEVVAQEKHFFERLSVRRFHRPPR
jgi:release factor glutamine methyltransferase